MRLVGMPYAFPICEADSATTLAVLLGLPLLAAGQAAGQPAVGGEMRPPAMALTTPAFPDGDPIPAKTPRPASRCLQPSPG